MAPTMRSIRAVFAALLVAASPALAGCGDDDEGSGAAVQDCTPANACSCGPGTERPVACTCNGGSTCEIEGNDIEFQCQGNAACGMTCGTNCLITCPGTTSCTVDVGDRGVVTCPGTATCNVRCRGDCTVEMTGAARSTVQCDAADEGAVCEIAGCPATDCGDGVLTCRTACP